MQDYYDVLLKKIVSYQINYGGPVMCTEFWVGWFDHWGNGGHMTGNLEESVKDLDKMLELGHVNIYMFEGGTNFGFMNGSNYYDALTLDVTSYDYDALLTEDGQITEKYRRYRDIIAKYRQIPEVTFERGADFDILMENMGRVNFGSRMEHQRKGIGQCVQINGHMHNDWKQYTLPLLRLVQFVR